MRRVVVTGLGAVSPLGNNVQDTFAGLTAGKSGISRITKFDIEGYPSQIAGEVKGLNPQDFIARKELKKMDTFIQYALIASEEAMQDSGIDLDTVNRDRFGTVIGSGIGGLPMIEREHSRGLENNTIHRVQLQEINSTKFVCYLSVYYRLLPTTHAIFRLRPLDGSSILDAKLHK